MFKRIADAVSILFQGTIFESRHKREILKSDQLWEYCVDGLVRTPPYVLTHDEFKIKNDLITKLRSTDNRLQAVRDGVKKARARWLPDFYEQADVTPPTP